MRVALTQSVKGLKSLRSSTSYKEEGIWPPDCNIHSCQNFQPASLPWRFPTWQPHNHVSRYPMISISFCLSFFLYICMYIHTYMLPLSWAISIFLPPDCNRSISPSPVSAFALELQPLALLGLQPADCRSWALSACIYVHEHTCAHTHTPPPTGSVSLENPNISCKQHLN